MMDYEFLRFAWWILVCVLLIGFAVTDGFDMGVLNLLPFTGKKEVEKQVYGSCCKKCCRQDNYN